jgi:hypothetical protein
MRRARWVTVLLVALVAGCAGAGHPDHALDRCRPEGGVQVQRRAFAAGGGSGIVASSRDRGDIGRDRQGNLWIADVGDNECRRTDTALLEVREPDPAAAGPARLLATYRYRFPDPPGCAGRNAEAVSLVDDVPYLIDKAGRSTVYRFPRLDPEATVTLEGVGVLAGGVANLSGADLSCDRRRLAVDSHTMRYVYAAGDPSPDGGELVADLISRPPALTVRLAGQGPGPANVEGVAFTSGGHDLNLLAGNRDVFFVPTGAYER